MPCLITGDAPADVVDPIGVLLGRDLERGDCRSPPEEVSALLPPLLLLAARDAATDDLRDHLCDG